MASIDTNFKPIDPSILNRFADYSTQIQYYSSIVGLPPTAFTAPIARESNKIMFDYSTSMVRQAVGLMGLWNTNGYSNSDLVDYYEQTKAAGITKKNASYYTRFTNPMIKDYGPGKIETSTAIDALIYYHDNIDSGSDPLGLDVYYRNMKVENSSWNLSGFLRDFGDQKNQNTSFDLTVRISAVLGVQIKDRIDAKFGSKLFDGLSTDDKALIVTAGYTMGIESLLGLIQNNINSNGGVYVPNLANTDGPEYILKNGNLDALKKALSGTRDNSIAKGLAIPGEYQWFGKQIDNCFLAGTEIQLSDGTRKNIEDIAVGDSVAAYSIDSPDSIQSIQNRLVTRLFRNVAHQIIDLRGLFCTPNHLFLTIASENDSRYEFQTIAHILKNDQCIVDVYGQIVRARTGCEFRSEDDKIIRVKFYCKATNTYRKATVRLGIPLEPFFKKRYNSDTRTYEANVMTLNKWLKFNEITVDLNGYAINKFGCTYTLVEWPAKSDLLEQVALQNWVVALNEDQPYSPPWIEDLKSVPVHHPTQNAYSGK